MLKEPCMGRTKAPLHSQQFLVVDPCFPSLVQLRSEARWCFSRMALVFPWPQSIMPKIIYFLWSQHWVVSSLSAPAPQAILLHSWGNEASALGSVLLASFLQALGPILLFPGEEDLEKDAGGRKILWVWAWRLSCHLSGSTSYPTCCEASALSFSPNANPGMPWGPTRNFLFLIWTKCSDEQFLHTDCWRIQHSWEDELLHRQAGSLINQKYFQHPLADGETVLC